MYEAYSQAYYIYALLQMCRGFESFYNNASRIIAAPRRSLSVRSDKWRQMGPEILNRKRFPSLRVSLKRLVLFYGEYFEFHNHLLNSSPTAFTRSAHVRCGCVLTRPQILCQPEIKQNIHNTRINTDQQLFCNKSNSSLSFRIFFAFYFW